MGWLAFAIITLHTTSHAALYYKLHEADLLAKDWPQRWAKYDILVTDPSLKNSSLAQIRKDLPRARIVAYTCMGWVYVSAPCTNCTGNRCSGCPGWRCVDRVDASGKSYWNPNFTVRNLHDGKPICPFGGLNHEVVPVATWIPTKESVEAMVRYHKDHTVVGYDGIYVDDYRSSYYDPWATYIEAISAPPEHMQQCAHKPFHGTTNRPENCSSNFAIDFDGHNSTLAALQAQYAAWRPYYTAKLREMLGDEAILIANVPAPSVADPALNGITVEFEHCKGDESPHLRSGPAPALDPVCMETIRGQYALTTIVAKRPPVFALWLTHSEIVPAAQQCELLLNTMKELPYVSEGDDMTDCTREHGPASCVRCNITSGSLVPPAQEL